jgi:hypothetical protein
MSDALNAARICEACGGVTEDPTTVWCMECGRFIGFAPTPQSKRAAGLLMVLLDRDPAVVAAGEEARVRVSVRNTGGIVDHMDLTVPEALSNWIRVDPPRVELFPNASAIASVVLAPPRSPLVRSGQYEFELVATSASKESLTDSIALVGIVQPFVEVAGELLPPTSSGVSSGAHRVVLINRGNASAHTTLSGRDDEGKLTFRFERSSLQLEPGTKTDVAMEVAPDSPTTSEQSKSFSFQVNIAVEDAADQRLPGSFVLQPPEQPLRLVLAQPDLEAAPGADILTTGSLRNTTGRSDHFRFELLGPAAGWGRVVPESAVAAVGSSATTEVLLTVPPAESGLPAWLPWGVRVVSSDGSRAAVAEGGIRVGEIEVASLDAFPGRTRGRWSGRYLITVGNRGSRSERWRLVGVDDADQVSFAFSHSVFEVTPGADIIVAARVRTRRPSLAGRSRTLPFVFALEIAEGPASGRVLATTEAELEQSPILGLKPPTAPRAGAQPKLPGAPAAPEVKRAAPHAAGLQPRVPHS